MAQLNNNTTLDNNKKLENDSKAIAYLPNEKENLISLRFHKKLKYAVPEVKINQTLSILQYILINANRQETIESIKPTLRSIYAQCLSELCNEGVFNEKEKALVNNRKTVILESIKDLDIASPEDKEFMNYINERYNSSKAALAEDEAEL